MDRRAFRIAVVGNSASGKSTLARRMSAELELPYYSIDEISWNSEGALRPESARRELHARITAKREWIIDGNSYHSMERIPNGFTSQMASPIGP